MLVIGSGPNGLTAACRLARAGLSVLVLEGADRPGGGLATVEATLPGFLHDTCAGFVTFRDSVPFRELGLAVDWGLAEIMSTHPAPDGTVAAVSPDLALSARHFGDPEDGRAFAELAAFHARIEPHVLAFLGRLPAVRPALALGPADGLRLARAYISSSGAFARHTFRSEAARRVFPAMGLHVDVGPDDPLGMPLCWMLTLRATTAGFAVPRGGMAAVGRALIDDLGAHGGQIRCGARVARIEVRRGTAAAAVLVGGERIEARRAIVATTHARSLYLELVEQGALPSSVVGSVRRFRPGWGTFKVDYALSGPVPWADELSGRSAVVHVGDSVDDLARFTAQVRSGVLPDRPYLVVGQQSLVDPSRAPEGRHTLYAYTHAPAVPDADAHPGGWPAWRDRLADAVTARIEELAPGFGERVLGRAIRDPVDLERGNANLIGGDLGGGSNAWHHSLVLRPSPLAFRYRTPIRGLYLGSSSTHPGPGVHGMCGWNAAEQVLVDV